MVKLSCAEIVNRVYICPSDLTDSIDNVIELFKQKNPLGHAYLGLCYEKGHGIEKNIASAVELYKVSAEQKHPLGQAYLGVCYKLGLGVEKNINKAIELYKLSAKQNHPLGQIYLGICYRRGGGVEKDENKTVELFKLSADQNYPVGQIYLGVCYDNGLIVEKNITKAIELYKLAAAQKNPLGQAYLGACYRNGDGVEKDIAKAVELYKLSADQNYSLAQAWLGGCYVYGTGVEKDMTKAVELYINAYFNSNEKFTYIESILDHCDKKQLIELEKIAKNYKEFNHTKTIRRYLKKFIKSSQYKKIALVLINESRACPICFEEFSVEAGSIEDSSIDKVYITKCLHLYHTNCVKSLDKCPLCREELIEIDI